MYLAETSYCAPPERIDSPAHTELGAGLGCSAGQVSKGASQRIRRFPVAPLGRNELLSRPLDGEESTPLPSQRGHTQDGAGRIRLPIVLTQQASQVADHLAVHQLVGHYARRQRSGDRPMERLAEVLGLQEGIELVRDEAGCKRFPLRLQVDGRPRVELPLPARDPLDGEHRGEAGEDVIEDPLELPYRPHELPPRQPHDTIRSLITVTGVSSSVTASRRMSGER